MSAEYFELMELRKKSAEREALIDRLRDKVSRRDEAIERLRNRGERCGEEIIRLTADLDRIAGYSVPNELDGVDAETMIRIAERALCKHRSSYNK